MLRNQGAQLAKKAKSRTPQNKKPEVAKKYKGLQLLQQVIAPSTELNEKFRTYQFLMSDGRVIAGTIFKEEQDAYQVIPWTV